MITNLCNEFIEFAKEKYGVNIKAESSDTPDTFEKIFGCTALENKLVIPFGEHKIVAEKGADHNYNEMFIWIEDKNGVCIQDLVIVGQKYHYDENLDVVQDDSVLVRVFANKDDDDYTNEFDIGVYKEEE